MARTPLSADAVVDAALALVAERGLEGLSMRALGEAVGVEAMSLYHWFPAKERLLDAIADRLIRDVELPALPAGRRDWRQWMLEVAANYRGMALAHPRAFPLVAARRFLSPGAIAFVQATVAASRAAGFDLRQAVRLTRSIGGYVNGVVLLEIAPPALEPSAAAAIAVQTLDAAEWKEVRAHLARPNLDGAFEVGLACLLDGALRLGRAAGRTRRR